jgi:hypothetical protein
VTALITLAALWAAVGSAKPWEGGKSWSALIMFGAGAVIAGYATRYCFSRERTFGDFTTQSPVRKPTPQDTRRQPAPEGSSLEPR